MNLSHLCTNRFGTFGENALFAWLTRFKYAAVPRRRKNRSFWGYQSEGFNAVLFMKKLTVMKQMKREVLAAQSGWTQWTVHYVSNGAVEYSRRNITPELNIPLHKTIILPVVLYGCETWTLTLREEHRLRVFENRVLRRIFVPKRDEDTGGWRKLHNEELHNLYSRQI
jgi:hypothetical protein